jgi:FkbM family methyltransferase
MNSLRDVKSFLKSGMKRFGLEVRRTEPDLMDFITNRGVDVVLDVGANVGQFGELLRFKGYAGKIISFEPIHATYQELAVKAAADGNWEASNFALGSKSEHTMINVSRSSVFSSILPSTKAAVRFDDQATVSHTEDIEVRKLDDISPDMSGNILLKIDTQGFEKEVLEGGQHIVSTVKGVLLELPIVHLYEGTWQFHEAVEYMSKAGFVPAQIHPVNYHSADHVSLVEVDCLFRPRDDRFD